MATIERRKGTYRIKVRRQGAPPLTATFTHVKEPRGEELDNEIESVL